MKSRGRATSNGVDITLCVAAGLSAGRLRAWAVSARHRLPARPGRLSVVVVSSARSRRLNRTYRGQDRPTNVLSWLWPADSWPASERIWGEIILCPAVIRREAATFNRTYAEHFRRLIEHGLIHLLGLDHITSADQRRWQRYARRLS